MLQMIILFLLKTFKKPIFKMVVQGDGCTIYDLGKGMSVICLSGAHVPKTMPIHSSTASPITSEEIDSLFGRPTEMTDE